MLGRSPSVADLLLLAQHTALEMLDLSGNRNLTNIALAQIGVSCCKLRMLDISDVNWRVVSDAMLALVIKNCTQLEILNVGSCKKLGDESIRLLGTYCPSLRKLVLNGCGRVTNEAILSVLHGCSELKELQLSGVSKLSDDVLKEIGEYCPQMEFLTLSQLQNITDEGIVHLVKLKKLRTLSITQCPNITGEGMVRLQGGLYSMTCTRFTLVPKKHH